VDEQHRTQLPKCSSEIGQKQIIYYEQGRIKPTRGPSEIVTLRPPERLAQLRSVSHALVSTLQMHW